jgi:hypothetical protein
MSQENVIVITHDLYQNSKYYFYVSVCLNCHVDKQYAWLPTVYFGK